MHAIRRALLVSLVPLVSCRQSGRAPDGEVARDRVARAAPPQAPSRMALNAVEVTEVGDSGGMAAPMAPTASPMIIRTGEASIEVDSVDRALGRVRELGRSAGGYVANSSAQTGADNVRSATMQLKVPVERFDQVLTGLAPLGKVESVHVTAQDVGEEYIDVEARVANSRRLEDRLIALLATRTGKLKDVLTVEQELSRVRGRSSTNRVACDT
jgi:uncharacterized protein DUF4349